MRLQSVGRRHRRPAARLDRAHDRGAGAGVEPAALAAARHAEPPGAGARLAQLPRSQLADLRLLHAARAAGAVLPVLPGRSICCCTSVQIEVANKLFLSAYIILFPLVGPGAGARAQAQPVAGAERLHPLVQPELDLRLLVVPHGHDASCSSRWRRSSAGSTADRAGSSSSLGVTHASWPTSATSMPWFCFGLCAIALLLYHARRWRRGLWASLAMLPSVGFARGRLRRGAARALVLQERRGARRAGRHAGTTSRRW